MELEVELVPLVPRLGIGLLLLLSGVAVAAVNRRAADGRLRRNALAGIRTRATLASDAAWVAGHVAARPLSDASAAVFAATGLLAALASRAALFAGVVLVGTVGATVLLLLAARSAGRAARSV